MVNFNEIDRSISNHHCLDTSINGFYAQFPPGPIQNISNTTYCQPKLRINFICDLNAHWRIPNDDTATGYAPEPTDINIDPNDPCSVITFKSKISLAIFFSNDFRLL
jgi:hypothetical protein